jgi:hypothetical protein
MMLTINSGSATRDIRSNITFYLLYVKVEALARFLRPIASEQ